MFFSIFFLTALTVVVIPDGAIYSPIHSSKGDLEIRDSQGTRPFEQPKSKPIDRNNSWGDVELQDFPLNDSSEEEYSDMGQLSSAQDPKPNTITQPSISTPTLPKDEYSEEKALYNDQFSKRLETMLAKLQAKSKLANGSSAAENFEQSSLTVPRTPQATKKGTTNCTDRSNPETIQPNLEKKEPRGQSGITQPTLTIEVPEKTESGTANYVEYSPDSKPKGKTDYVEQISKSEPEWKTNYIEYNPESKPKENTDYFEYTPESKPKGETDYVEYEPESKPKMKVDYVQSNLESEPGWKIDYVEYSPESKPKKEMDYVEYNPESKPNGETDYVEYEPESKPKMKMDYVEPNIESEPERKVDYVEYSPESKPKGQTDYVEYSPESKPERKSDYVEYSPESKSKYLTTDQKKPIPNQKQTTLNQKSQRKSRVPQTVKLEFPEHRVEESYRLLGKEAEAAHITRYYGFINTTCGKQKVHKFISFVEHQRTKYQIYELDMKKFNKQPAEERAYTCEHYINKNVILRQQGISFDRSEDPDSVKVVRKKLNFSINQPSRIIRVIVCPCKNTNYDKSTLYVIPVMYIDETQDSYLFVFKDDKTNPNTTDDIKLKMLSRVEENSVPNDTKQKPEPTGVHEKLSGFFTFLYNIFGGG